MATYREPAGSLLGRWGREGHWLMGVVLWRCWSWAAQQPWAPSPLPAPPSPTSMAETLRAGTGRSCRSMSSSLSLPSKSVETVTGSQGQAWTKPSLLAPSLFFLRFLLLPNVRTPMRHPDILPRGSGLPHGPDPGTAGSMDRAEPGLSGPHQRATLGRAMPDRASVSEWGREGEKPKL